MELANQTVNDLKGQRDFLIRKAVGGQRLALFRCTFSYKFATEKAWMRWVMFTKKTIKAEYTKATKINV